MEDNDTLGRDYPPVLDAALVAQLLRLNVEYVRKLSREKRMPAHQLPGGRTYRYFRDEVLDWLRRQPIGTPAREVAGDDARDVPAQTEASDGRRPPEGG